MVELAWQLKKRIILAKTNLSGNSYTDSYNSYKEWPRRYVGQNCCYVFWPDLLNFCMLDSFPVSLDFVCFLPLFIHVSHDCCCHAHMLSTACTQPWVPGLLLPHLIEFDIFRSPCFGQKIDYQERITLILIDRLFYVWFILAKRPSGG